MGVRVPPLQGNHDYLAWFGNSASGVTVLGALFGLLPPLAALAAIAWYLLQMYESKTYRDWRERRQRDKKKRKIAKLQAQQKVIAAELEALETMKAAKDFAEHMVQTVASTAGAQVQAAKNEAAAVDAPKPKQEKK